MKIKICGIKYKENLGKIIPLKPDFLGFNFYPVSQRFIGENLSPGELALIPRSIKKAGVFVNQDEYEVSGIKWKYGLDYVQLHGNESPEMCKSLNKSGLKLIKAFSIDKNFRFDSLMPYIPWCDYFLFDTPTPKFGGSGKKFEWKLLENYNIGHPFFLSGGIKPEDAGKIKDLAFSSLSGIDINSGFESEPGIKDIDKIRSFLGEMSNVLK